MKEGIDDLFEGIPEKDLNRKYVRHLVVGEARRKVKEIKRKYKAKRNYKEDKDNLERLKQYDS